MLISPNKLTIDLGAIVHNLGEVRGCIGPGISIMGIVKSDAYGHGMVPVSKTLEKNGVYSLGVSFISEALMLREEGIRIPVIILCGIDKEAEAFAAVDNGLTPVVYDLDSAERLERVASIRDKRLKVHVKIDTGMGRLGIDCDHAVSFIKRVAGFKSLEIEALMSHLSSADEEDIAFTKGQIERFNAVVNEAKKMGLDLRLNHLANSAGIIAHKGSHFDMVRPGIMLYGGLPSPDFKTGLDLRPVMGLKCHILQIREFNDNTPVSYGRRYYTEGNRKIAIVSAGYADGIPRAISNRGRVIIGGEFAPIRGNVCMNMLACDITGINAVKAGDECTVIGTDSKKTITGDEIAGLCSTISYEVYLSFGKGLEREYI
ncbi:MAG: alanine racemase [Desulfatiglans sp.]|nr:alanine racemase [Desulfatiglans sp.]